MLRRIVIALGTAVAFAAAGLFSSAAIAQAASPLAGTWKVNLAKSKYDPPSAAPQSGVVKIEITGDAIKVVNDGVDSQGRKTHSEYTAKFDGKDYPWKGTIDGQPNLSQDTVAWTKIDERTYELVGKLKGQSLGTQRIVVAADGKTRTNTIVGTGPDGKPVRNTVVLDRQ